VEWIRGICFQLADPDENVERLKREIAMPDAPATRVSIPFGTTVTKVSDEALKKFSFDLVHFPSHLARKIAPRVRVEIMTVSHDNADLTGWFSDQDKTRAWRYARLVDDENSCLTDSDDFYQLVHKAFAVHADGLTYIGFTRCGLPPDAPLFGLALMYRKYGRGIYLAGQMLPTLWPESSSEFLFTLR
jgi:hypothetical protein